MKATAALTNETDVLRTRQSTQSFPAIERICANVAHDLKNPVNNILLSATALKEMKLNEEQAYFVEMIMRNTDRINSRLTELVNATHLARLKIRPVNICDLLDEVLLQAGEQLNAAAITVKRNYPEEKHHLPVDYDHMKNALLQLVYNAIEAINKLPGLLELTVWNNEDASVIELKDNGRGIAEEMQQQIFEPYFTTKQGKRGLGLTIAQTIILSHGGSLTVQSYPAFGTTIVLRLRAKIL